MQNHRVEWRNIPKRAAWFGGFYERLIGLTKLSLKKVLGRAHVTMDELSTLVTEVEATINDRPITYVGDGDPLTPSHLILGRLTKTLPYRLVDDDELSDPTFNVNIQSKLQKRAKYIDKLHEHFWKRWVTEYLTSLHERHSLNRQNHSENVIKEGDVVIIHDDKNKRLFWNLALVEELNYGNDGLVRSANIRTKWGQTNRPITKLYRQAAIDAKEKIRLLALDSDTE
jgi:hypothetical protein